MATFIPVLLLHRTASWICDCSGLLSCCVLHVCCITFVKSFLFMQIVRIYQKLILLNVPQGELIREMLKCNVGCFCSQLLFPRKEQDFLPDWSQQCFHLGLRVPRPMQNDSLPWATGTTSIVSPLRRRQMHLDPAVWHLLQKSDFDRQNQNGSGFFAVYTEEYPHKGNKKQYRAAKLPVLARQKTKKVPHVSKQLRKNSCKNLAAKGSKFCSPEL